MCLHCRRDYVYPVAWDPAAGGRWLTTLKCGTCERVDRRELADAVVEALDENLDLALSRALKSGAGLGAI